MDISAHITIFFFKVNCNYWRAMGLTTKPVCQIEARCVSELLKRDFLLRCECIFASV